MKYLANCIYFESIKRNVILISFLCIWSIFFLFEEIFFLEISMLFINFWENNVVNARRRPSSLGITRRSPGITRRHHRYIVSSVVSLSLSLSLSLSSSFFISVYLIDNYYICMCINYSLILLIIIYNINWMKALKDSLMDKMLYMSYVSHVWLKKIWKSEMISFRLLGIYHEKIGMDSDRNYSIFIVSSKENEIIPIGIHSNMFHDKYPDLGIVRSNFIQIGRNWKISMTLYNKSVF